MRRFERHFKFLLFVLLTLATVACQDGRKLVVAPQQFSQPYYSAPLTLQAASEVRFQNQDIQVQQMVMRAGSLFLTGKPFGFARWEVSADPENPSLTFAASDRITDFSPMGRWIVDWYASNALGLLGNYAFMSGTMGLSAVSIADTSRPFERGRYPAINPNSTQTTSDEAFKYRAILSHPTLPLVYGFREQDFIYTLSMSNAGLQLVSKDAYAPNGATVCCVRGGTVFANRAYIAFRDHLAFYDFSAQGQLVNPGVYNGLNVTLVASTQKYLYLFHDPVYQTTTVPPPKGVYVFDQAGQNVAYFAMNTPLSFAVAPNDTHIYANFDNTTVQVLRMLWTNQ